MFILESEGDRAISTTFFTHWVSIESTGDFFPKIAFLPLLVAILNFCIMRKYGFISETEQDRAISMKFFTHRVSADPTGNFSEKSFGGHVEFLRKTQKTCLSQKQSEIE